VTAINGMRNAFLSTFRLLDFSILSNKNELPKKNVLRTTPSRMSDANILSDVVSQSASVIEK